MKRTLVLASGYVLILVGFLCAVLAAAPVAAQQRPTSPPKPEAAQTKPEGEMRWAIYVTMAQHWFDPGEVLGNINPFWFLEIMTPLHSTSRLLWFRDIS